MARQVRTALIEGRQLELSNLDKTLWPEDGYTKAHFLHYLAAVGPSMLPHYRGRPLVLTRYPDGIHGESFYQKDCPDHAPPWVRTYPYWSKDSRRWIRFILCDDLPTLVWVGNLAGIEMHPWLSTARDPLHPNLMVLDIDPAAPAGFEEAREVAFLLKAVLDGLGLAGFPKTSGATGIHVYVPVEPRYPYRAVAGLVRAMGEYLLRRHPRLITMERAVARRTGHVYVDYLQNVLGKTLAGPYSPRPLAGASVSCPVTWAELETARPADFTIITVPERVARLGDPFAGLPGLRQRLEDAFRAFGL